MKDFAAEAFRRINALDQPRVVEIGTRRSDPDVSTHHRHLVPNASSYIMVDIESGPDVHVVADAHCLSGMFGENRFEAYVSCSTLEHLRWPWKWAQDVSKLLVPGGICYVQTHHTFPLHAYPNDYFRFSLDALGALFDGTDMVVEAAEYQFPCEIKPPASVKTWNPNAPAYLNVCALIVKR